MKDLLFLLGQAGQSLLMDLGQNPIDFRLVDHGSLFAIAAIGHSTLALGLAGRIDTTEQIEEAAAGAWIARTMRQ